MVSHQIPTSNLLSLAQSGMVLHQIQAVEVKLWCNSAQFVIIPLKFVCELFFLPWNRLTLVLCISVSNFALRVFTRLLIASDQFGPFSNAVGWIHSLGLSWQFFLLGCWVLPPACRSSCRVPHSGLLLLLVLFPFGWTPIVQLMFVCELFFYLPWNRLTLVLCISMSNFAPRVFTRLLIASDQFGPFSNAVGWIHGLQLSWQIFLLGCWVLPPACRSSCQVPHSGLLSLPVLFPFGWTPIVQLMFVCELFFFFCHGTD